jgi:hypothetical protein
MGLSSWIRRQVVGSVVGSLDLKEVAVNKWMLALMAFFSAVFSASFVTQIDANTMTKGSAVGALVVGLLAFSGKLYDPGAALPLPRIAKALGMGIPAALALIGPAMQDGAISGQEWGGILSSFLIVAWSKWSSPEKVTG